MPPRSALHPRAWGTRFDSLPSLHSSLPLEDSLVSVPKTLSPQLRDDRLPHDASVFVGSLPTNIEQPQLTRLLEDHLSEYTAIKSVKVIRDSRGGICAFVQCQDAASASALIDTLRSTEQKPFFGRILRYEPARAFRTLLISYRVPMQCVPHNGNLALPSGQRSGETVELDLPFAMRLWKSPQTKFHSILYNEEAVIAENNASETRDNSRVFLQPLVFDADALHQLAECFGPLEKFDAFQPRSDVDEQEDGADDVAWSTYPPPHNAPRTTGMDSKSWEVKWEHREDCINALLTLRKVPHLTVTWIHQPYGSGFGQRSPTQAYSSNAPYSFHPHATGSSRSFLAPPNMLHPQYSSKGSGLTIHTIGLGAHRPGFDPDRHPAASGSRTTTISWTEDDFPPLGELKIGCKTDLGVWSEQSTSRDASVGSHSPAPPTSLTPASEPEEFSNFNRDNDHVSIYLGDTQVLSVPSTPGLDVSKSPMTPPSQFPKTPTSAGSDRNKFLDKVYHDTADQELDPTAIFVGGLEMNGPGAWDEEKIKNMFKKYEGLESVKFVRPQNAHAAFAFVKFNNTESPARAVQEEHNRVYSGRTMRVQLCGANPWRHNRGRGRFQHHHFSYRKYDLDDKMSDKHSPEGTYRHSYFSPNTGYNDFSAVNGSKGEDDGSAAMSTADASPKSTTEAETDTSLEVTNVLEPSPIPPAVTLDRPSPPESYHECYEDISSAPGIPSTGSSMPPPSAVPTPYVYVPGGSYYPPPLWMPPYGHAQYPSPYYGAYSGYPAPGHQGHPSFGNLPTLDMSGHASTGHTPWAPMGMYGSYISYPTHSATRAHSVDQSTSPPVNGQPPVVPTGFIQNDHGTLIAVYQPEALDRYMAGTGAASSATAVRQAGGPSPGWSLYPHAQPHPYSAPLPLQAQTTASVRSFQHGAVAPGWAHFEQPHMHMPPHAGAYPLHPSAMGHGPGFRPRYNNNMSSMKRSDTPVNRGKANRGRDQTNTGRHGHARSWGGRPFRANMRTADHSDAERQDNSGLVIQS